MISPAPFGDMSNSPFADSLIGGEEKSHALAAVLAVYCKENDIEMFDAGTVISLSDADGIHLEEPEHLKLGKAIAGKVRKQLQSL